MAILGQYAEDCDFITQPSAVTTTAGRYDSNMARYAIDHVGNGSSALRSIAMASSVSSFWFTGQLLMATTFASDGPSFGVTKLSDSNDQGIYLGTGSVYNKVALLSINGSGTITRLGEESGTTYGTLSKWDVHVVSLGASAEIHVYRNGSSVPSISFTGDLSGIGVTAVDRIILRSQGAFNMRAYISEMIIADEDTRLLRLKTLAPNAAGDANAWTGAYTDIDENTANDTDMVYTDTASQDAQFNLTGMPSGTWTVRTVKLSARMARSSGSTPTKVALGVKTNSSISAGTAQTVSTTWDNYQSAILTTNPVTSNIWQGSEIDALQLNIRSST